MKRFIVIAILAFYAFPRWWRLSPELKSKIKRQFIGLINGGAVK
jgi:hypothetical protein